MNLFKNMADQETAQYNSTTPITCLILCWLLINNNMKSQRPNTAHVFGIRVFNSPICPICFWSKLGFAENELIWLFILCTIVHLLNRGTPHCRFFNHLILTHHLHHHTPLIEYNLKHLYVFPHTRVLGSWDITHTYHRLYTYMCIHVHVQNSIQTDSACIWMHQHPHEVHLHAAASICIHTEDPLDAFHPSAYMSVTMHAYPCMCMHMHADGWLLQSFSLQFNVVWVVGDGVSPGTFRGWRACVGTTLLIHLDDSLLHEWW